MPAPSAALGISQRHARMLYALRNFSAVNHYTTLNPGGEAGIASGFGVAGLCRVRAISGTQLIAQNMDNAANGWQLYVDTSGSIVWSIADGGAGTFRNVSSRLTASDLGRVLLVYGVLDAAGIARLWVSRVPAPTSFTLTTGYSPYTNKTQISGWGSSLPAPHVDLLALAAWRGAATDAALQAYADATRVLGDLPAAMAGGPALTHRWSLRDALAGLTVIDGQIGPASMADTVTLAAADAMGRVGSPAVVAIDTSIDGRRSYGAQGFSSANYLRAQTAGIRGSAAGLTVFIDFVLHALAPASGRIYSSYNDAIGAGCSMYMDNGPSLGFYAFGGPALNLRAFTTVDVGQRFTGAVTWDGTTWTPFLNGVAGTPVAGGLTRNTTSPMWIGYGPDNTPATIIALYGIAGCDQALTPAEVAQVHATLRATGVLDLPSGKTNPHVYDLTRNITANGGPELGVPAQVNDLAGTDHLTRVGTGLTVAQRRERVHSFEASPIMYAAEGLAWNSYFMRSPGFAGDAAGWWFNLVLRIASQNVPSRARTLLSCNPGGSGFSLYSYTTNSMLQAMFTNAAGSPATAPSIVVSASDVGKVLSIYGVADVPAGKAKLYHKRADQLGSTMAGYKPALGGHPLRLGDVSVSDASEGVQIIGYQHGLGVPTFPQIAANYDAAMAEEDVVAIPGMTASLYSLTRSIRENGGLMPATLLDRISDQHMTTVGSPTVAPLFARAWGH